jgi:hypothetical protein
LNPSRKIMSSMKQKACGNCGRLFSEMECLTKGTEIFFHLNKTECLKTRKK